MLYNNALVTLTTSATPDPFVVHAHNKFYLTYTCGDHIEILASSILTGFRTARPITVWRPPPATFHSNGIWAPELHALDGRWYIYYAAQHPALGNRSHRMYVIGGPPAEREPTLGPWTFLGGIRGMPEGQWAIDGTVFALSGKRYLCYSGWPRGETQYDLSQELFITRMDTPLQAGSQPVQISSPQEPWEHTYDALGNHGINEGPQWLVAPNGAWQGLVYSCGASWTHEYKMGILHYQGGDPLHPASWRKDMRPLLQSKPSGGGPYGPGHGSFVYLADAMLHVFHATDSPSDGWKNRRARAQQIVWNGHGPFMGGFVGQEVDHVPISIGNGCEKLDDDA